MKYIALLLLSMSLAAFAGDAPTAKDAPATKDAPGAGEAQVARTDGEIWNEGVEFYRAGDVTNALRVLRPLMLSRTHGARAGEVVAALEYAKARDPEAKDALAALEEAAAAAQIALRAAPDDPKANRNFTRATDGLAEMREAKRVNAVLARAGKSDPGDTVLAAAKDARSMMKDAEGCFTNTAERAVAMADSLAQRATKIDDTWLLAREAITQSVTNEQQAATIIDEINKAKMKTLAAARELGDLNPEGYASIAGVEEDLNRFFKMMASAPSAIREDLAAQSNACTKAEQVNGRDWQREALDLTRRFRAVFPAFAMQYEQQAQADTNKPPFTAEQQAKISDLSTQLEKIQLECCENPAAEKQNAAHDLASEIIKLLPNDNSSSSQNQQQQNQQQNQNQQNQQQQNDQNSGDNKDQKDQQQNGDENENNQNEEGEQNPDENNEDEKGGEDEKDAAAAEETDAEKSPDDKEIEALIMKAKERNDEHEKEKKMRMRRIPLPPSERDW